MILIVLGPQASGKGTQAKLLVKELGCRYFESGDFLREKAKGKTSLAQKINRLINQRGVLVPDDIMKRLVNQWLNKAGVEKSIVFDGHPRNISQYHTLGKILASMGTKIDRVIYLHVSRKVSIERMSARRICPQCGAEYNLITKLPKRDELCDRCQKKLIQRQDDAPEVIKRRLAVYYQRTQPLIRMTRQQGILEEIDGERPIKEIYRDIKARLKRTGLLEK